MWEPNALALPPPAHRSLGPIGRLALAGFFCICATSCYTLTKKDIFEVAFQPLSAATLIALSDEHHVVERLPVADVGPPISAYWDHGDSSSSILIFFNGNGYGAEPALRRLLIPARKLGLDLIVFNYYDQGQTVPSMAHIRATAQALFDTATTLPTPAAKSIMVGGHSLGATFALDTAVRNPVEGVFVAAPATTGVAMIKYQLWYSRFAWLRPDEDYRQFDNIALAKRLHRKIIVFGSAGDADLPPNFTKEIFAALPADDKRKLIILENSPHSEYFRQEEFWRELKVFFGLNGTGPFVGYLSETHR
jgi:pimeloyl-ACP methyl ester carboxylesterase